MKLFTIKQVSEMLGIAEQTIRNNISRGKIRAVKVIGSTRITQEELERITGLKYKEEKQ